MGWLGGHTVYLKTEFGPLSRLLISPITQFISQFQPLSIVPNYHFHPELTLKLLQKLPYIPFNFLNLPFNFLYSLCVHQYFPVSFLSNLLFLLFCVVSLPLFVIYLICSPLSPHPLFPAKKWSEQQRVLNYCHP